MTALVTATQIRDHIETDLPDAAITRLIDDADADIVAAYGAHTGDVVEHVTPGPGDTLVFASRPVSAITSIVETFDAYTGTTDYTLGASEYALEGSHKIRRKQGASYPRLTWAPRVTITYTPVDDTARRTRITIDLVRLGVRYEAASMTLMGDTRVQHVDYELERTRILQRLDALIGSFA